MVSVERVEGRRGVARFVDVAWTVQADRGTPWVPPLRAVVRDLLDDRRNPFYERADRALFIARRDGRPAGRIAAIENRWHNEHHDDRTGFFGRERGDDLARGRPGCGSVVWSRPAGR